MYDGLLKGKREAVGVATFVGCEIEQRGKLSLLPLSKGSKEWDQA